MLCILLRRLEGGIVVWAAAIVCGGRIEEHAPYDADFCCLLGEVNVWNEISH
jgi:hypothetical protein